MNIDAEIAEKLFMLPVYHNGIEWKFTNTHTHVSPYSDVGVFVVPILEALRKKGFSVCIDYCTAFAKPECLVIVEKGSHWMSKEETLPLALCKAALMALEGK